MAGMLPREYPPWQTLYYHFRRKWRIDGRLRRAHDRLRDAVREAEGRDRDPSAAISSTATRSLGPPRWADRNAATTEREASRRTRKRHTSWWTPKRAGVGREGSRCRPPRSGRWETIARGEGKGLSKMELLWAEGAYMGGFCEWLRRQLGWRLEVPHHPDRQLWRYGLEEKPHGFQVLARRWVVERTFAWLGLSRRFSKDYERLCLKPQRR